MARAIDPNAVREIITPWDKKLPVESQTRWKVKNLTVSEYTYLMDPVRANRTTVNALHLGFLGAEPFLDEQDNPVEFVRETNANSLVGNTKPWTEDCLSRIHPRDRDYIAGEIIRHAEIKQEAAKNS